MDLRLFPGTSGPLPIRGYEAFELKIEYPGLFAFMRCTSHLQAEFRFGVEGGRPTKHPLAYYVISKCADGLPLNRQKTIYLRDGVSVGPFANSQWGFSGPPAADRLASHKSSGKGHHTDISGRDSESDAAVLA
ncbi:hypothetical protein GOD53_32135 [Sinorhizobium medicae]|nr:hypothetical protein [Sinorhizobium medicae]MDX0748245.1 hypothetical protein [Sinorhizobium medicae]